MELHQWWTFLPQIPRISLRLLMWPVIQPAWLRTKMHSILSSEKEFPTTFYLKALIHFPMHSEKYRRAYHLTFYLIGLTFSRLSITLSLPMPASALPGQISFPAFHLLQVAEPPVPTFHLCLSMGPESGHSLPASLCPFFLAATTPRRCITLNPYRTITWPNTKQRY